MTEPTNLPTEPEPGIRPDPAFKQITGQQAEAVGLRLVNVELPQVLAADLILEVPPDVNLENTLFSFLTGYDYAVLDFKSENDTLDMPKLLNNVARTALFCSRYPDANPGKVLNLIVSSRYPQDVLAQIKPDVQRTPENWLWLGGPSYQPLAIVVCRDLPLEPAFYEWLAFTPINSQVMKKAVIEFLKKGRRDLVDLVRSMKLKEFDVMLSDLLKDYTPQEKERFQKEYLQTIRREVTNIVMGIPGGLEAVLTDIEPEKLKQVLSNKQTEGLAQQSEVESAEAVAKTLTAEQLRLILQRKEAEEQNN